MSDTSAVKALVFDVFGTVVDWRTSLIADFTRWSETRGIKADWTALVDGWRAVYAASMDEVRKHPERGYMILDTLHRQSLEKLVAQMSIKGLADADLQIAATALRRKFSASGFLPDVRRILRALPVRRQTLLFSATMPDEIASLSRELLREPAPGRVSGDRRRPRRRGLWPLPRTVTASRIRLGTPR